MLPIKVYIYITIGINEIMFTRNELEILEVLITEKYFKTKWELDNSGKKLPSPDFVQGLESYMKQLKIIYDKITNADLV